MPPLLQPFGDDTAHVGGGHGEDVAALDIEAELFEFGVAQSSEAASEVVVAVGERQACTLFKILKPGDALLLPGGWQVETQLEAAPDSAIQQFAVIGGGDDEHIGRQLIDLKQEGTHHPFDFTGFVLIAAFFSDHIEFIEEEQTALAASLGKELSQAHGSFAKKAADQGFVAHHEQGNGQFKGKGFGEGGFAVAWRAHQKKPVAGFKVMGAQQVGPVVLLNQLRTGLQHTCWKEKIRQPPLGAQLLEQAGGTVEADRGDWGRGLAVTVELEMGGQPVSEHVMLLGAFLGDQGFQGTPKELLVALGSGADDIDEQVSPGHGGDKAGVAGACGNAPRQVAAS